MQLSQLDFMTVCSKHRKQLYFKGANILKKFLVAPKDKDTTTQKSGVIYMYKWDRVEGDEDYIVESTRTFGKDLKNTLKPISLFMNTLSTQAIRLV